jgi:hydroxymethylbilane synthase
VSAELFNDGTVYAKGIVGLPDGKEIITAEVRGHKEEAQKLGSELTQQAIDKGAKEMLVRAEAMAEDIL